MSAFSGAPLPKTRLGRHRILSPTASVRVSPLCLGSMNFGEAWEGMMGSNSKENVFKILDQFYASGGNFIDTSNNYQNEQSETWIGEWMAARKNRDQMVIATKFSSHYQGHHGYDSGLIQSNFGGNNSKSLHLSLRDSLKKLGTDYIDILYVHWWDHATSIPELMHALNDVVTRGQVLYLGASDIPAWVVSSANQYARDHGLRPFVVYQGLWNAATRDFERDIIPMARHEGMALAPWGALGGGHFKTKKQREDGYTRNTFPVREAEVTMSDALEKVATRKNTLVTSVALAYVMHKTPYVFPIVGGRTVEHLQANIEALGLQLTKEDIKQIEDSAPFDIGFPQSMLAMKQNEGETGPGDIWLMNAGGVFDYVDKTRPISAGRAIAEDK